MNLNKEEVKKMTKDKAVVEAIKDWKETRMLTLNWIEEVSLENLNTKLPRPGLNSYAKHIYEMAEIQDVCRARIEEKEPDLEKAGKLTNESDLVKVDSKKELKKALNEADSRFFKTVKKEKDWKKKVEIFGVEITKRRVIDLLSRHETLHHGQFVAFAYILDVEIPDKWKKIWALPDND